MDITGLGSVADLAKTVVSRIWPDKTQEDQAQLAAALVLVQGQLDANKAEASNPTLFVSGWRPFIGWICGLACAWNWIGLPDANAAPTAGNAWTWKPANNGKNARCSGKVTQ
jgi:hypothetical protein